MYAGIFPKRFPVRQLDVIDGTHMGTDAATNAGIRCVKPLSVKDEPIKQGIGDLAHEPTFSGNWIRGQSGAAANIGEERLQFTDGILVHLRRVCNVRVFHKGNVAAWHMERIPAHPLLAQALEEFLCIFTGTSGRAADTPPPDEEFARQRSGRKEQTVCWKQGDRGFRF